MRNEDRVDQPQAQEPEEDSELEQAFREMLADRFLDGLIRRFERLFPEHAAHVEDVLLEEIARLVEGTGAAPRNIRALLTWRMRKRMLDVAKRPTPTYGDAPVDEDSPERLAIRKEMFEAVKALIDGWENKTMALVVRLTLEAVYYGEILEVDDIKDMVLDVLQHQLTTANVWQLRSRGLKRLATEVARLLGEFEGKWQAEVPDDNHLEEE